MYHVQYQNSIQATTNKHLKFELGLSCKLRKICPTFFQSDVQTTVTDILREAIEAVLKKEVSTKLFEPSETWLVFYVVWAMIMNF